MAALIDIVIPQQGFEKVRDKLGVILTEELNNQKVLQQFEDKISVFSERIIPMSTEEDLYFNIVLDNAVYDNFTEQSSEGKTTFFIDVYTAADSTSQEDGSLISARKLHKFIGMARYILSHTYYQTLGFDYGMIAGTYVDSFSTAAPDNTGDSRYTCMGRLNFSVRIQESQSLWEGISVLGSDTTVRLDQTDKGYKFELNTAA